MLLGRARVVGRRSRLDEHGGPIAEGRPPVNPLAAPADRLVLDRRPEHLEEPAYDELEEHAPERRVEPEAMGEVVGGLDWERVE